MFFSVPKVVLVLASRLLRQCLSSALPPEMARSPSPRASDLGLDSPGMWRWRPTRTPEDSVPGEGSVCGTYSPSLFFKTSLSSHIEHSCSLPYLGKPCTCMYEVARYGDDALTSRRAVLKCAQHAVKAPFNFMISAGKYKTWRPPNSPASLK